MTLVHRFGAALNAHLHFHGCVIDGLFSAADEGVRFHPAFLTDRALAKVQRQTRGRVLKLFQRRAWLPADAVETLRAWEDDGGFSVNAEVWVPSRDRAGLERLLRYCARPLLRLRSGQVFAGERLAWAEPDERLICPLPKPRPDGQRVLTVTPLDFLDHLAALMPPPRKHRHRDHGVLAPHSPLPPPVSPARSAPLWDTADWDQTPAADPDNGEPAPEFQFDQTVSW